MNHYCQDCHVPLKPITPEYTGATVTRLHCPECGATYRIITGNSATQNERVERETFSLDDTSASGGRAVTFVNRNSASG